MIPEDALSDHKGRLKGSGEDDVSKWIQSFKRPLGKKFPEFQDHVTRVAKLVQSNFGGKAKAKLQELAVKFGITATHASRMGIKSLSTCIAAAAFCSRLNFAKPCCQSHVRVRYSIRTPSDC